MRPLYETNETLAAERKVVEFFCAKWKTEAAKLPIAYNVDYVLTRENQVKLWLEVKCRHCKSTEYETYFISAKKIVNGLALAESTNVPFYLAIQWQDRVGYLRVLKGAFDVRIGGRKDRDDWQDVEPMAHFKINDFTMCDDYAC
jgi:hypothetical protein